MTETTARPTRLPRTGILAPDGTEFTWGPVDAVHTIGRYSIVEFREDHSSACQEWVWESHGRKSFHPYIDGRDTNRSYRSLDSALVGAIAQVRAGLNTQAARHFDLMTLGTLPGDDA